MNIFLTNKFQSTRDDVHNVGPVLHEFIIEQLVFYSVGHVMQVNHLPPKFLNATTTTQESVQDDLVTRGANSWLVARMPKKELQVIRTTTTTATRKTLTRTSTKNWVTTNCLYYIHNLCEQCRGAIEMFRIYSRAERRCTSIGLFFVYYLYLINRSYLHGHPLYSTLLPSLGRFCGLCCCFYCCRTIIYFVIERIAVHTGFLSFGFCFGTRTEITLFTHKSRIIAHEVLTKHT